MANRTNATSKATAAQMEKDPEVKIENALGRTEAWFEKNWKSLSTVLVAVLVVAAGVYAYQMFVRAPRERKAADAMFVAEQLFVAKDYATALAGDGTNQGFVDVVAAFGGTRQGRLAAHYAGICYAKAGEWDNALEYLGRYRAVKGAPGEVINAENEGLKGDIFVQKGDYTSAVAHFRKAVDAADNILTTPLYLKKLGLALEASGDAAGALAVYKRVKENYPASLEARDIDKYAAEVEQKL